MLSERGLNPVAHDDMVLWSEFESRGSGPEYTEDWAIVLQRGNDRTVISTSEDRGSPAGYAFADTHVVWSYLPPGADVQAYAYSLATGTTQLSDGEAFAPTANAVLAAWIEYGTDTAFRIVTRPIAGGPTTTRAELDALYLKMVMLDNGGLIYAGSTSTGLGLYLVP